MASIPFPLPFRRQFAGPLDEHGVFQTTAELNAYLISPLRYAGMQVTCVEQLNKIFVLNADRTAWDEVGNDSGGGVVDSVVAGSGVSVDATDPANPIVSAFDYAHLPLWKDLTYDSNILRISEVGVQGSHITVLNEKYVVLADYTLGELRVYELVGLNYVLIPSSILVASMPSTPKLATLNKTDFAVTGVNSQLALYRFNGVSLSKIGPGSGITCTDITSLSDTHIAVLNSNTDTIGVYQFNFTTLLWTRIDNILGTIPFGSSVYMTALNATDIVLCQNTSVFVYRYNYIDGSFTQLGTTYTATFTPVAIESLNNTDVLICDSLNQTILRFDGYKFIEHVISASITFNGGNFKKMSSVVLAVFDHINKDLFSVKLKYSGNYLDWQGHLKGDQTSIVDINGTQLSSLGTGLLKNTTGTGVLSIAVNSDLPVMTATVGGAVPTPPNNTTTFLRGDGTFATPAGGGGAGGLQPTPWDLAASSLLPADHAPGLMYEITGANATRDGEFFIAGDIAIVNRDDATVSNITSNYQSDSAVNYLTLADDGDLTGVLSNGNLTLTNPDQSGSAAKANGSAVAQKYQFEATNTNSGSTNTNSFYACLFEGNKRLATLNQDIDNALLVGKFYGETNWFWKRQTLNGAETTGIITEWNGVPSANAVLTLAFDKGTRIARAKLNGVEGTITPLAIPGTGELYAAVANFDDNPTPSLTANFGPTFAHGFSNYEGAYLVGDLAPRSHKHDLSSLTLSGAEPYFIPQWNGFEWVAVNNAFGGDGQLYQGVMTLMPEAITNKDSTTLNGSEEVLVAGQGGDGLKKCTVQDIANLASAGGVNDGDKGDIIVSGGGTVWSIDQDFLTDGGNF